MSNERELSNEELTEAAGGLKYQSAEGEEINLKTGKANNPTPGQRQRRQGPSGSRPPGRWSDPSRLIPESDGPPRPASVSTALGADLRGWRFGVP